MNKDELISGEKYRMKVCYDGHPAGTKVVFKWWTSDGKWAVCNPVGEPDMQSSMCLSLEELEKIK